MLLSDVLKYEMSKRNLSIDDMAEATGLSYNKIRSYTLGTIPKPKDLDLVCEAIGIDQDTLVFDKLNISVNDCSKLMGKSPNYVKYLVRKGVFGSTDGKTYHIPRLKFEEYMGMRNNVQLDNIIDMMFELLKEKVKKEKATATNSDSLN
ncbi:MAG: helix-turn-helix domain-containing protein [Longibaculum sp.]